MPKELLSEDLLRDFRKNAGLPLLENAEPLQELSDETRTQAQARRQQQLQGDPNHRAGKWFTRNVDHYGYNRRQGGHEPMDAQDPRLADQRKTSADHANQYYNDATHRSQSANREAYQPLVQQVQHQALEMLLNRAKASGLNGVTLGLKSRGMHQIFVGALKLHPQAQKISTLELGTIHDAQSQRELPIFLLPGDPLRTGVLLYAEAPHLRALQALLNLQVNLGAWAADTEEMLVNVANAKGPQGIAALDKATLPPLKNYLNKLNQEVVKLVQLLPKELTPQASAPADNYFK